MSRRTRCRAEAGQAVGGFPAGGDIRRAGSPGVINCYLCRMKKFVISLLSVIFLCAANTAQVLVGMTDTTAYFPQLEGRRVAVLANHTAVARFGDGAPGVAADAAVRLPGAASDGTIHLVDLLHGRGFDVTGIFSPSTGSAVRPTRASMSPVRWMPRLGSRSARSTTGIRSALRTKPCGRSTYWWSTCRTLVCGSIPTISRCSV